MKSLIALVVAGMMITGCSNVTSSDANVIAQNKANVVAMNNKIKDLEFKTVDKDGNVKDAPWVKQWWQAEQTSWEALDAWANKRRATPGN
jgi:hypothetical protein